jgi:hypothetical protein
LRTVLLGALLYFVAIQRRRRNLFAEDKNMITHDNYNEPNKYIVFSRLPERLKPINAGCLKLPLLYFHDIDISWKYNKAPRRTAFKVQHLIFAVA